MSLWFLFFFFQAEDGIRDTSVTGVQTCALPIFVPPERTEAREAGLLAASCWPASPRHESRVRRWERYRSEERRVGKECRSRGSADRQKKNSKKRTEEGRTHRNESEIRRHRVDHI